MSNIKLSLVQFDDADLIYSRTSLNLQSQAQVKRHDARLDQKASSEHNEPSLDVQGRTKFFWSDIVVLGDGAR